MEFHVELVQFVNAVCFTIYTMLMPQVISEKVCLGHFNDTVCSNLISYRQEEVIVQKHTAWWNMVIFLCTTIPSIFCIQVLGSITDIVGRKIGFIYLACAMITQNTIMALSCFYRTSSPGYIVIASLLAGTYGDIPGTISICYSHMADITTIGSNTRTKRMSILESVGYFAGAVGGLTAAIIVKYFSFLTLYICDVGFIFLGLLYVLFTFKNESEYLTIKNEQESSIQNNSIKYIDWKFFNPFFLWRQVIISIKSNSQCFYLTIMLFVYFSSVLTFACDIFVIPLYLKGNPHYLSLNLISYYTCYYNSLYAFGLIVLACVTHFFSLSDNFLIILGFLSQIFAYVLTGVSRSVTMLYLARVAGFFNGIVAAAIRSKISKLVLPDQYGSVLGAVLAVDIVSSNVINIFGIMVYVATFEIYSGILLLVIAVISSIGLITFVFTIKTMNES